MEGLRSRRFLSHSQSCGAEWRRRMERVNDGLFRRIRPFQERLDAEQRWRIGLAEQPDDHLRNRIMEITELEFKGSCNIMNVVQWIEKFILPQDKGVFPACGGCKER